MNETLDYNKKKYSSFIASIILHILVLLILYYFLKVSISNEISFNPPNSNPAKVTFFNNASIPGGTQLKTTPIAIPNIPNGYQIPIQNESPKKEKNIVKNISLPIKDEPQVIAEDHNSPTNETAHDNINNDEGYQKERQNAPIGSIASDEANIPVKAGISGSSRRKARNRKITGAQLMQAFSSIYRKEQAQQNGVYGKINPENYGTIFSDKESQERAQVQERADEWKIHLYQDKVLKAISHAASLYGKDFYSNEDIETIIRPKLVIDINGKIAPISNDQLTGNENVDKEILKFLNSANIPGVPKNFGLDTFIFTLNFKISLKKGINKIYITTGW